MHYDTETWFEGSRWYDTYINKEVEVVFIRSVSDFRIVNDTKIYGVPYEQLIGRMRRIDIPEYRPTKLKIERKVGNHCVFELGPCTYYLRTDHIEAAQQEYNKTLSRPPYDVFTSLNSVKMLSDVVVTSDDKIIKTRYPIRDIIESHLKSISND